MQVSEEQRRVLYERLREHLDDETATLVLEVTVPANVELATRADLQELRGELLLRFADLEERLGARQAGVEQRLAGVEHRLAGVEERLATVDGRISGVEQRLIAVEGGMKTLETGMRDHLNRVVIPILIGSQMLLLALAAWLSR